MESHRTRVFMENLPRRACAAPWACVSALGAQVISQRCHMAPSTLAASGGVGTSRLQRPSSILLLLSIPLTYFFSRDSIFSGAVSHGPEHADGFRWRWDLTSPTTFSPCGYPPPSPDALGVL